MLLQDLCATPIPPGFSLPEEVWIHPGAGDRLGEVAARYLKPPLLVLSDENTRKAALGPMEKFSRAFSGQWREMVLSGHAHTDDPTIAEVMTEGGGIGGILAVGSGTINDIAKAAATRLGVPYLALGTAASMNGYASGIVAVTSNGLKTTLAATPPRAILLDTEILCAAPLELTQAGLGDLLSKPVSLADWWLSHQVEGAAYSELPGRIVSEAIDSILAEAAGIPARSPSALETLARAVVLSGVSMVVAGSSSPASGGEHLISHLWDMRALAAGRPLRLHGAQVGVATLITSALYQRVLSIRSPEFVPPRLWEAEAERIGAEHGPLAATVLPEAEKKHRLAAKRLEFLRGEWAGIRERLVSFGIPSPDRLRKPLLEAGAPHTLAELGVSREEARQTLLNARDIRSRYTVLDLAYELGVLPYSAEEVLGESGV